jgi:hypothetical protein
MHEVAKVQDFSFLMKFSCVVDFHVNDIFTSWKNLEILNVMHILVWQY